MTIDSTTALPGKNQSKLLHTAIGSNDVTSLLDTTAMANTNVPTRFSLDDNTTSFGNISIPPPIQEGTENTLHLNSNSARTNNTGLILNTNEAMLNPKS